MGRKKTQSPKVRVSTSTPRVDAGLANACPGLKLRAPVIKPKNVGCVFGHCNLKVGVLSPEAYAALLEEL